MCCIRLDLGCIECFGMAQNDFYGCVFITQFFHFIRGQLVKNEKRPVVARNGGGSSFQRPNISIFTPYNMLGAVVWLEYARIWRRPYAVFIPKIGPKTSSGYTRYLKKEYLSVDLVFAREVNQIFEIDWSGSPGDRTKNDGLHTKKTTLIRAKRFPGINR